MSIMYMFTKCSSCLLLTIESDLDLIITCLMSKSLCLGWSCETGPSRNITTVMVFQNSAQIVTLPHRVCQCYMAYSLCRNITHCTMKLYVLSPPSPHLFHSSISSLSFLASSVSLKSFFFVCARWGCYAGRCSDRRQDHQGIVFICLTVFKLLTSLFSRPRQVHRT